MWNTQDHWDCCYDAMTGKIVKVSAMAVSQYQRPLVAEAQQMPVYNSVDVVEMICDACPNQNALLPEPYNI